MSLVELLVALAVLGILFGFLVAFFARQSSATAQSQAQNELQVKLRGVGEVLLQDLELVGARNIATAGSITRPLMITNTSTGYSPCPPGDATNCIEYDASNTLATTMYYLTSLTPSAPCHRVVYWLDSSSDVLYRFDQAVSPNQSGTWIDQCVMPAPYALPPTNPNFAIASGITKLQIDYTCSSGSQSQDPSCASGYVTGARVVVDGQTSYRGKTITGEFSAKAPTPNLGGP